MPKYSLGEKTYNIRMAGRIRRLHIRPMNGEEQNVAAHTWGLVMIMVDLFPDVSKEAILFALRHDVPEVATGDIPANVKWANPDLEKTLETLEQNFMHDMGWTHRLFSDGGAPYHAKEELYLKFADRIELLFYCLEQMYMGNWLLADVYVNVRDKITEMLPKLSPEKASDVVAYIDSYSEYLAKNFSKKAILSRDTLSIS